MGRVRLKPVGEQVVVLMGASSGIGRASALAFARRGARVVVSARSAAGLSSLVSEIRAAGGTALAVPADVRHPKQVRRVAEAAVSELGGLDTWVHLAAVSIFSRFEDLTAKEWERVVDIDLNGQAYGAMAALPVLRAGGGGSLVHVSSVLARASVPLQAPYCAAKHGVDGFVKSLRQELRHEGAPVQVAQILPATVATPFFDKARSKLGVRPAGPPPVYAPEVVARAIVFAAGHRVGDLHAGGAAVEMLLAERLSRRANERLLGRVGWRFQHTGEVLPVDAPDAVDGPIADHDVVRAPMPGPLLRHSAVSLAERRPLSAVAAVLVGAGVARALSGLSVTLRGRTVAVRRATRRS